MRPAIDVRRAALILTALVAACFPGWLVVGSLLERPAEAQEKEKEKAADKRTSLYYPVSGCSNAGCHGGNPPKAWGGFTLICRCDEAERWTKHDKHADAYKVLLGERGQRMGKILRYEVTKAPQCLSCHSVVIKDEAIAKDSKAAGFTVEEGVSCVACHGAYLDWVLQHSSPLTAPKWRPLSRSQKESQYGMTDLWDPETRTKLCASCHIGNAGEGKVVTHDMYAAGHPPLPGFEVAMFGDEMPRHWETRSEKKDEKLWKEQKYDGKTREQTQLLLVGSAVGLGESLRLISAQAGESLKHSGDPELAMFDCYSCHHEIRSPSWRQTRLPVGKPGRVPMRTWPIELVRLSVRHLAKDDAGGKADLAKLDAHMVALQKAFTAKQLGDADQIVKEANLFAKWADKLAKDLQDSTVDEAATRKLLDELPTMFAKKTHDFDSARQIAWGYEVLSRDLGADKEKPPAAIAELQKYLRLRLPKGRMKDGKSSIEAELGDRMKLVNDYQPDCFRQLLGKLGKSK